jgi:hypothetical protein
LGIFSYLLGRRRVAANSYTKYVIFYTLTSLIVFYSRRDLPTNTLRYIYILYTLRLRVTPRLGEISLASPLDMVLPLGSTAVRDLPEYSIGFITGRIPIIS